jgi:hypothetical protein
MYGHEMDAWRYSQMGGYGSATAMQEAQRRQEAFWEQYQKLLYNVAPPPIFVTKEQFKDLFPLGVTDTSELLLLLTEEETPE